MKELLKSLWRTCFNDTEAFVDLYFDRRYRDDLTMTVSEGDRPIAALQMIPYPMTYPGGLLRTSYISGACTHPDARNRGVMKRLLNDTLQRMYEEGVHVSTLIPAEEWLFGYYQRFGYEALFNYAEEEVSVAELARLYPDGICENDLSIVEETSLDAGETYPYFNRQMNLRACCIQHTPEDYGLILADHYLGHGRVFAAKSGGQVCGLLFCLPEKEGAVRVKEGFYDSRRIQALLLKEAALQMHAATLRCVVPPHSQHSGLRLGMARVINAQEALSAYAANNPQLLLSLCVKDPIIGANNACYTLSGGGVERGEPSGSLSCVHTTINQLTQLVFGGTLVPYMSLMLN